MSLSSQEHPLFSFFLRSSALHLTTTKFSTFKKDMRKSIEEIMRMSKTIFFSTCLGDSELRLGVTMLPATLNTRSDFELAAGTGKITLTK